MLPRPLSSPFAFIPDRVHGMAAVTVLNRLFAAALRDGDLDYLAGRSVCIRIRDLQLGFCITLQQHRLVASREKNMPDLTITGNLHSFLLLAARHEDSDTQYFQRQLRMEGDTELGLEVKNFLDGIDVDSHWLHRHISNLARRSLPFYERTFSLQTSHRGAGL